MAARAKSGQYFRCGNRRHNPLRQGRLRIRLRQRAKSSGLRLSAGAFGVLTPLTSHAPIRPSDRTKRRRAAALHDAALVPRCAVPREEFCGTPATASCFHPRGQGNIVPGDRPSHRPSCGEPEFGWARVPKTRGGWRFSAVKGARRRPPGRRPAGRGRGRKVRGRWSPRPPPRPGRGWCRAGNPGSRSKN